MREATNIEEDRTMNSGWILDFWKRVPMPWTGIFRGQGGFSIDGPSVKCFRGRYHDGASVAAGGHTYVCVALLRTQGGWAIETIQQGEYPKITASNLVSFRLVKKCEEIAGIACCVVVFDECQQKRNMGAHRTHSAQCAWLQQGKPMAHLLSWWE